MPLGERPRRVQLESVRVRERAQFPRRRDEQFPRRRGVAGAPRRSGVSSRSTNTSRVSDGSETTSTADVTRRGGSRERFSTMASFPSSFRSTSFASRVVGPSPKQAARPRASVRAPRRHRVSRSTSFRVASRRFGSRSARSRTPRAPTRRVPSAARSRARTSRRSTRVPSPKRKATYRRARRRALARRIRPEPERRRARRDVHRAHASVLAERVGVRQRVLRLEKRLTSAPDRLAGSYRLLAFTRRAQKSASRSASVKKLGAPSFGRRRR